MRGWLLGVAALAAGCFATEDSLRADFAECVAAANECSADAECALVGPGCPLGCHAAVRTERRAEVEACARDLVEAYERFGRVCQYDCMMAEAACEAGRCAVRTTSP